jgi:predicted  nucleic acid-binding Zn-ribbon protein
MLKNVVAPIQAWLLSQHKCVGCGKPLEKAKRVKFDENSEKVTCNCGRIFIYNKNKKAYRRALISEV